MNRLLITLIVGLCCATSLNAGNVFLTGHDVNLHGGQSGYDEIILNYLRDDIAIGAYSVGYLTRGGTSAGLTSIQAAGYGVTTADVTGFADGTAFDAFLAGIDILVVPWVVDIGVAGSNALNGFSGNIETFFNAGGDIWANSAHTTATYYDFLPPGAAGSGPSISGSTGFTATTEGALLGITSSMMNGFATHNSFSSFDSAFTVFETRLDEVISIGLRDALIVDGEVIPASVPEPSAYALMFLGFVGIILFHRRQERQQSE